MKILQALKKIKHIDRKIEKQSEKIQKYCSVIMEPNDPAPPYDAGDISKMLQSISDLLLEKARIRAALHKTNVATTVEFNGANRTIDELLLWQNVVIPGTIRAFKALRRKEKRNRYEETYSKEARVLLQYDPRNRDRGIEEMEDTLQRLDDTLDNLNIETDVIGLD